jgi:hypothetical protein
MRFKVSSISGNLMGISYRQAFYGIEYVVGLGDDLGGQAAKLMVLSEVE